MYVTSGMLPPTLHNHVTNITTLSVEILSCTVSPPPTCACIVLPVYFCFVLCVSNNKNYPVKTMAISKLYLEFKASVES